MTLPRSPAKPESSSSKATFLATILILVAATLGSGCVAEMSSAEHEDDEQELNVLDSKADSSAPRLPELDIVYRTTLRSQIGPSGISRLRIDTPDERGSSDYRGVYRAGGAVDLPVRVKFVVRRSTRVQLMRLYTDEFFPDLIHEFQISFDHDGYFVLGNGSETLAKLEPLDEFGPLQGCIPLFDSTADADVTSGGSGSVVAMSGNTRAATAQVVYLQSGTLSNQLIYDCSLTVANDTQPTREGTCAILEGGTPDARAFAWMFWEAGATERMFNLPLSGTCDSAPQTLRLGTSSFVFETEERWVPPEGEDPVRVWVEGCWCPSIVPCCTSH